MQEAGSSNPWGRGKARGVWSHGSQDRKVSEKERMFYPFKSFREVKKNEKKHPLAQVR